ncbi:MAG: hypothetical protein JO257_34460 [Deltaproteobacteria bacterium]|nr:hypothetical protein [Deltaproteobacteria bacterium]
MRRVLLALLLATGVAQARSEKTLAYPRPDAWAAAVRFIRVDAKLKITEKDADAGYVIFELREEKRTFRGSLELVDTVKDGRHLVRFVLTIEDRPEYVEIELLNKLEQKLRAELGSPAPAPSAPPPKKEEPPPPKKDEAPKKDDDGPPVSNTP